MNDAASGIELKGRYCERSSLRDERSVLEVQHYRTSSNLIFFISDEIASAHRTSLAKTFKSYHCEMSVLCSKFGIIELRAISSFSLVMRLLRLHQNEPRKDIPRLSLREAFFASKQSHLSFHDRKDEICYRSVCSLVMRTVNLLAKTLKGCLCERRSLLEAISSLDLR